MNYSKRNRESERRSERESEVWRSGPTDGCEKVMNFYARFSLNG